MPAWVSTTPGIWCVIIITVGFNVCQGLLTLSQRAGNTITAVDCNTTAMYTSTTKSAIIQHHHHHVDCSFHNVLLITVHQKDLIMFLLFPLRGCFSFILIPILSLIEPSHAYFFQEPHLSKIALLKPLSDCTLPNYFSLLDLVLFIGHSFYFSHLKKNTYIILNRIKCRCFPPSVSIIF